MSDIRLYRVMRDLEGKHCGNEYLGNLVTCGECKHWHSKDNLTYCDRINYGYGYKFDDFCSYGEPRRVSRMPYEEDYKMWLEKMLIKMNPDWVCDGMYDTEFTHDWCYEYCGKDDLYITPKCLHMYYHHIARADRKTENSSEKPNNCEHITEDGVTCAKYPACDDCLNNPLNKVKGSERLVKGSEKPNNCEHQTIRCPKCGRTDYIRDMEKDMGIKGSDYKYKCINCNTYIKTEPQTEYERIRAKEHIVAESIADMGKTEPQIYGNEYNCIMTMFGDCSYAETGCGSCKVVEKVRKALEKYEPKDEPQTERSE